MNPGRSSPATAIAAVLVALVLALEVARLTVASAVADDDPGLALRLAPGSPDALASTAMAEVGEAAARAGDPSEATFQRLRSIAVSAPFRTEPFLVEAAMAERVGDYGRARTLLLQARSRNPRSVPARYLFADTSVRQGNVVEALRELAVLSRLLPAASVQLVPALAQFAQTPGSRDKLAAILNDNPQLKNPLLAVLSADPSNADLVLSLAPPLPTKLNSDTRAWQARLLRGFIAQGRYQQAYDLWRQFAKLPKGAQPLLFNGSFESLAAPAPFNWDFSGSSAGVAEPRKGNLRVVYYGRDNVTLATQLLVLPAGKYRFDSPISGKKIAVGALAWKMSCVGAKSALMELRLSPTTTAAEFTVPSTGCPAQQLQLDGISQESPQDTNVRIGPAKIDRIGG